MALMNNVPHPAAASAAREIFQIGFAGHRELTASRDYIKMRIEGELRRFGAGEKGKPGGQPPTKIIAHSSIACGADMLFAETALALGIEWHVHLPFPAGEFRRDFSEADWARASALMAKAAHVHEGPPLANPEAPAQASRTLAYSACGKRIADASNVFVAVWDELPERGPGGTGETVEYAVNRRGLHCFVINPARLYSVLHRP